MTPGTSTTLRPNTPGHAGIGSSAGAVLSLVLGSLAGVGLLATARAADLEQLLDARARTQYSYYAGAASDIEASIEALERVKTDPIWADLAHYYVAYANYRLAQLTLDDKDAAAGRLNQCVDEAKPATRNPDIAAEAYALQSACLGLKASVRPLMAVYYGPNAGRKIKKALKLDPDNPRVVLLDAVNDYYRPRAVGGNKQRAFEKFNRAAELYGEAQTPRAGYPDWGEAETQAYLGNYYLDREDAIRARNAFEQALLIAPDYKWVQQMLPRLAALQTGD